MITIDGVDWLEIILQESDETADTSPNANSPNQANEL